MGTTWAQIYLRLIIYSLLLLTFLLGQPSFHYTAALMIALIIKHKDNPDVLNAPIPSAALPTLSWQPLMTKANNLFCKR